MTGFVLRVIGKGVFTPNFYNKSLQQSIAQNQKKEGNKTNTTAPSKKIQEEEGRTTKERNIDRRNKQIILMKAIKKLKVGHVEG